MHKSVRSFKETIEFRGTAIRRLRSHRKLHGVLLALLILLLGCFYVWQRVVVIELAKDVSTLRVENRLLVDKVKKVQSEVSGLSMATRIENYAIDSLGLVSARADNLFTLVRRSEQEFASDELTEMFSSIKRVVDFLPVATEAHANDRELHPIRFEDQGETQ